MRELRVSRSSSDCKEGSGARQAADVKLKLKSYITKKGLGLGLDFSSRRLSRGEIYELRQLSDQVGKKYRGNFTLGGVGGVRLSN